MLFLCDRGPLWRGRAVCGDRRGPTDGRAGLEAGLPVKASEKSEGKVSEQSLGALGVRASRRRGWSREIPQQSATS